MTGIPLAIIKAAGLPEPDPQDLEAIIAQEEANWDTTPSGTWYADPACLEPVEEPNVSRETIQPK